jgi:hypothetical protein
MPLEYEPELTYGLINSTEGVRLRREPGIVEARRAFGYRADTVFPIVARHEVAAGIAHDRGAKLADQRHDILAEAFAVGSRVARFEYAAINTPAQVLDESAK